MKKTTTQQSEQKTEKPVSEAQKSKSEQVPDYSKDVQMDQNLDLPIVNDTTHLDHPVDLSDTKADRLEQQQE